MFAQQSGYVSTYLPCTSQYKWQNRRACGARKDVASEAELPGTSDQEPPRAGFKYRQRPTMCVKKKLGPPRSERMRLSSNSRLLAVIEGDAELVAAHDALRRTLLSLIYNTLPCNWLQAREDLLFKFLCSSVFHTPSSWPCFYRLDRKHIHPCKSYSSSCLESQQVQPTKRPSQDSTDSL